MEATYSSDTETHLRAELEEKGLYLLSVSAKGGVGVGGFRLRLPRRRRIPTPEFLLFNQELATLLKAGLPLVQSLDLLRRRVPNPLFKSALDDIYDKVRAGSSLSESFEAQHLFPGVYTASLMAGEKSGSLETVIRRYIQTIKVMLAVRSKVVSALVYPVVLMLLSAVVVGLIVFLVVPKFAEFYSQFGHGAELPMSTQIVVAISTNLLANGVFILIGIVLLVTGGTVWWKRPGVKKRVHASILRLPWAGPLARRLATAQVSRTLATLLAGGIPLVNALDVSSKSIANRAMADDLSVVARQVREGKSLGGSLGEKNIFPHVAVEMVDVGEQTGALSEMLNSVADFYDEENENSLTRFSNLIQPLLLIVMGIVIAGLLLSLYMPLFKLSSLSQ